MAERRDPYPSREVLIDQLSKYPPHHKGQFYEDIFAEACERLKNGGAIDDFQTTEKHSADDNRGIDVIVNTGEQIVFFQVTSSLNNASQHKHTNGNNPDRPPIQIVPIREGDHTSIKSLQKIKKEIRKRIKKSKNAISQ